MRSLNRDDFSSAALADSAVKSQEAAGNEQSNPKAVVTERVAQRTYFSQRTSSRTEVDHKK